MQTILPQIIKSNLSIGKLFFQPSWRFIDITEKIKALSITEEIK